MTPRVTGLWRHPIKSHGREALTSVRLEAGATMPWDRTWAVAHDASDVDGSAWAHCRNFTIGSKAPGLMAIDARLLVLDEPTLGLDILFRKQFYSTLLSDYYDASRTIIVTTHQVEEIEHVLTHVLFINHGAIVLDTSMEALGERCQEVRVRPDCVANARMLAPISERQDFGRPVMVFEGCDPALLAELGETRVPSIADLFVAKLEGSSA